MFFAINQMFQFQLYTTTLSNTAFTLNDFDDQKRNLMFVKTDFQVLQLKFYACNFKQAFHLFYKLYIV